MKKQIFLTIFIVLVFSQPQLQCTCDQVTFQKDCENMKKMSCIWVDNKCRQWISYCDKISKEYCLDNRNCSLVNNRCTFFTGCTPFNKITDQGCQQISKRCITDGIICVEINNCNEYKKKLTCIKNKSDKFCYWDYLENKCIDADTCDKLPSFLDSDEQCSLQIKNCITTGAGCTNEGEIKCTNFQNQKQCENILPNKQICFWTGLNCVDKTCKNAPSNYNNNDICNQYSSTCITTGAGCIINTTCSSAQIQKACVKNALGIDCIWDNLCKEKTCENAPITVLSNEDCAQYFSEHPCIRKLNGGCQTKTDCSSITTPDNCFFDGFGNICFWNGRCIEKSCSNAPQSYQAHYSCYNYSDQCTVNYQLAGCVERTCQNLSQSQCYGLDIYQQECQLVGTCYKKQCSLAPLICNTHICCQNYLNSCTVKSTGNGCSQIPLKCSGNLTQDSCHLKAIQNIQTNEIAYEKCGWSKSQCTDFQCSHLTSSLTTTKECNKEMTGCVVNNLQKGCMTLPLNCSDRKIFDNCEININSGIQCIWDKKTKKCIDKTCDTAQFILSIFSPQTCRKFLPFCTSVDYKKCIIASQCNTYINSIQCNMNQYQQNQCVWDDNKQNCVDATCSSAQILGPYFTDNDCFKFQVKNEICTVININTIRTCVSKQDQCEKYRNEKQCFKSIYGDSCFWHNYQCWTKSTFNCKNIFLINYSHSECENIIYYCKVNTEKTGCISKLCTDFIYADGKSTGTIQIQTNEECQVLNPICTINNAEQKACQNILSTCSLYIQQENCSYSTVGQCVWINERNKCVAIDYTCFTFTDLDNTTCKEQQVFCLTKNSGSHIIMCFPQDCGNFTDDYDFLTYKACKEINSSCVNYNDNSGCQRAQYCEAYSQRGCTYDFFGYKCFIRQSTYPQCVTITSSTCNLITGSSLAKTDCQLYNHTCTAARNGNICVPIVDNCSLITDLNQCVESKQGKCIQSQQSNKNALCINLTSFIKCNQLFLGEGNVYNFQICNELNSNCTFTVGDQNCSDKNCENSYHKNSFKDCNDWLKTCTFNGKECIQISNYCHDQPTTQCFHSSEGECIVFNNLCVKKTCETASIDLISDQMCSGYLETCTVGLGGCQSREIECIQYLSKIQCVANSKGDLCYWNNIEQVCLDFLCENIIEESPYDNHQACYSLQTKLKCTIKVESGYVKGGCQPLLQNCSSYQIQEQCVINSNGQSCEWQGKCLEKSCSTAVLKIYNNQNCKEYLKGCTVNSDGLSCTEVKDCEDYLVKEQCVSNKIDKPCYWEELTFRCITRQCSNSPSSIKSEYECSQYLNECAYSNFQCQVKICEYITTKDQCTRQSDGQICQWVDNLSQCIVKSCETAPLQLKTLLECQDFFHGCKIKKEGGCVKITKCSVADLPDACKFDSQNVPCIWDYELDECRDKICEDYLSQDFEYCKKVNSQCILSSNGYCRTKTTCDKIDNQFDCGSDGDCLWIQGYQNKNDTFGACFLYSSCASLSWKTHAECSLISDKCTTNGTNCIPIRLCNETNVEGGCIKGVDGDCYQYIDLDGQQKCKLFNKCEDIQLITHKECQNKNKKCTSDGIKCINLMECNEYNNFGCFIDKNNNSCFYENSYCRLMECKDIKNNPDNALSCSQQLSNCVSDGTQCVKKGNCDSYQTKIACNSGGLDEICIFNESQNKCLPMTSCEMAHSDEVACTAANDKCIMESNQCNSYTCHSYYNKYNECKSYFNWDQKLHNQTFCFLENGECKPIKLDAMNDSNCLINTNYMYTWDNLTKECVSCLDNTVNFEIYLSNSDILDCNLFENCLRPSVTIQEKYISTITTIIIGYLIF